MFKSGSSAIYRLLTSSARRYATEAQAAATKLGTSKLIFNLLLPHQALIQSKPVHQVNLSAVSGDMGVLANHVPVIEELKPGVVEVIEHDQKRSKYFVSGGFAIMHPDSTLNINAIEAFTLDSFDPECVKASFVHAQEKLQSAKNPYAQGEAKIEIEVLSKLQHALLK